MAGPVKHPADRVNVLGVGVDPLTVGDLQAEVGRLVRDRKRGLVLNAGHRQHTARHVGRGYQGGSMRRPLSSLLILLAGACLLAGCQTCAVHCEAMRP